MPLYEYRCASCGHQQEFLQKWSAAPLTVCTACGKESFKKLLTAAGFQLKGSGWYATDFKHGGSKPAAKSDASKGETAKGDTAKGESAKSDAKPEAKGETKSDGGTSASSPASGAGGTAACS